MLGRRPSLPGQVSHTCRPVLQQAIWGNQSAHDLTVLPCPLSPCRVIECRLLEEVLLAAARRFRAVKFVKIVSTAAVENWPDRNLPTLFVYHDGELRTQLLGIKKLGGRSTNVKGERAVTVSGESEVLASKVLTRRCYARGCVADLEWWLASHGIVETDMEENPRKEGEAVRRAVGLGRRGGRDDDSDGGYDSDT